MHPFRAAVEARDLSAVAELLAEDVVFRSPIVFKPYRGREAVSVLLAAVAEVFEDFRYEREIGSAEASDHALIFKARIGDRESRAATSCTPGPTASSTSSPSWSDRSRGHSHSPRRCRRS